MPRATVEDNAKLLADAFSGVAHTNPRSRALGRYTNGVLESTTNSGLSGAFDWVFDPLDPLRSSVPVLNVRTEHAPGLAVIVAYNRYTRQDEVTGIDTGIAPEQFGSAAAGLNSPQKPANVPTPTTARDIIPGGVFADAGGGLNVRVGAYQHDNGYWTDDDYLTLTPTATSSRKSFAVVGVDRSTNALTYTLTADRVTALTLVANGAPTSYGQTDIQAVIDADPSIDWRGAVELTNGDTAVNSAKIVPLNWIRAEMVGADGVDAGVRGLVPKPAATDNTKALFGDGTWKAAATAALDNLASVAINTSLISDTDSTDDLGSTSKFWRNGYIDTLYISEQSAPSTPASGSAVVYAKTDGKVYSKDDAGNEYDLTAGAGGSGYTTVQDEGSSLTARSTINFVGGGVTATDDGSKTVVTIPTGTGDYIMLSDTKTQNTAGGTFTSGAWRTRDLNTENADAGGHCSLSSNEFTLAAGTYRIKVTAPAYFVGSHRARLYNVTDAAVQQDVGSNDMYGTTEYSRAGAGGDHAQTHSFITGRFTLASSKALRVEHRCVTTCASIGFGVASNLAVEVYTTVEIIKE